MKIFFLFLFVFTFNLFCQDLPDYRERSFSIITDSLLSISKFEVGTDGKIDQDNYKVGPGDKFILSIIGIETINENLIINYEGDLFIPYVGIIPSKNKTLAELKIAVENEVNKYYKNVKINFFLNDFRNIKVSLLGDVRNPSTYNIKSNTRLFDLIAKSSGLTQTSNYRNILISSIDGTKKEIDLLKFLRYGDYENNPFLIEGDVIFIDKIDKVVRISGAVKFPGTYEFKENETVSELLILAGGLLSKARADSIEIVRFINNKEQTTLFYSYNDLINNKIKVQNHDLIVVRDKAEYLIDNLVYISGYVKYPGYYQIKKNVTTLRDIINDAGGLLPNASLTEATLFRELGTVESDPEFERLKLIPTENLTEDEYDYLKARSRHRKGKVIVDFEKVIKFNDEKENILLKRGDRINIPEYKNYVILIGQVVRTGNYEYSENLTAMDYINLAGGFAWRALKKDVRIIKANTGEWVYADDVDVLKPGDTIWVPEDPPGPKFWDVFMTSLTILGQISAVVAATIAVIVASR